MGQLFIKGTRWGFLQCPLNTGLTVFVGGLEELLIDDVGYVLDGAIWIKT